MHILLGVLSTLSIIAVIVFSLSNISKAIAQTSLGLSELGGRLHRLFFARKANQHPLSQIQDPREAALALMVAIMKDRGELTSEQISDLEHWAEHRLNYSNPREMVTLARWHVKDFVESGAVLYRLAKPMAQRCSGPQRADIIDLATLAARSGHGRITALQAHTIKELKYKFGDLNQEVLLRG